MNKSGFVDRISGIATEGRLKGITGELEAALRGRYQKSFHIIWDILQRSLKGLIEKGTLFEDRAPFKDGIYCIIRSDFEILPESIRKVILPEIEQVKEVIKK